MRSGGRRIVVVFPAPFGPRKPKISPSLTTRSTSTMPRYLPYDLVSCWVSMTAGMWSFLVPFLVPCGAPLAGSAISFAQERPDHLGDLALDERHDVMKLLEPCPGLHRPVGDRGEAALGDGAHVPVDAGGAAEQRVEALGRGAGGLTRCAPSRRGPGRGR